MGIRFRTRANDVDMPVDRVLNKVGKGFAVALIHAVVSAAYMLRYGYVEPPARADATLKFFNVRAKALKCDQD